MTKRGEVDTAALLLREIAEARDKRNAARNAMFEAKAAAKEMKDDYETAQRKLDALLLMLDERQPGLF